MKEHSCLGLSFHELLSDLYGSLLHVEYVHTRSEEKKNEPDRGLCSLK